jgi:hypothetical protein
LVISFPKLSDFSQATFDSAGEIVPFGLSAAQFIFVALSHVSGTFRQFDFKARPCALVLVIVFALEEPEGFLCAELSNASEISDAKPIQYLRPLQLASARA